MHDLHLWFSNSFVFLFRYLRTLFCANSILTALLVKVKQEILMHYTFICNSCDYLRNFTISLFISSRLAPPRIKRLATPVCPFKAAMCSGVF